MKQYLIERISLDPSENQVASAVKWEPQETTTDLAYAERCVNESPVVTSKDCWAIMGVAQSVRFREIESKDESYIDKLTELQKEIGYLPGVISPVAMLGLMGEVGEVAGELNVGFVTLNSTPDCAVASSTISRRIREFERLARKLDNEKKIIRDDRVGTYTTLFVEPVGDGVNLRKELGDTLYYLNIMATSVGLTLEDLARMSYEKVMEKRKTMAPEQTGN